jgi:hypothetical protein
MNGNRSKRLVLARRGVALRTFDEAVWLVTIESCVQATIGLDVRFGLCRLMPERRRPQAWPQLSQTAPLSGVKSHRKFVTNCAPDLRNVRNGVGKQRVNRARGARPVRGGAKSLCHPVTAPVVGDVASSMSVLPAVFKPGQVHPRPEWLHDLAEHKEKNPSAWRPTSLAPRTPIRWVSIALDALGGTGQSATGSTD